MLEKNMEHSKSIATKKRVRNQVNKSCKPIPWGKEEVRNVLAVAGEEGLETLLIFELSTGLRQLELLQLAWKDVDLDKQTVRIQSHHTERLLYIPRSLVQILKAYQEEIKHLKTELVFPNKQGEPLSASTLNRRFKRVIEKAGVPPIRFQHLRDLHGQMLLQEGVSPLIIKNRLGHSTLQTTLDHFSPVLMDKKGPNVH
jgi:integrase